MKVKSPDEAIRSINEGYEFLLVERNGLYGLITYFMLQWETDRIEIKNDDVRDALSKYWIELQMQSVDKNTYSVILHRKEEQNV